MVARLLLLFAVSALCVPAPATAHLPPGLAVQAPVQAQAAIDSDTLRLADGRELRLVAIVGVKAGSGDADGARHALAEAGRALLERLAAGRRLDLAFNARSSDRYGRVLAHAATADGTWLQGEMLRAGLARVATSAETRAGAAEMLALEDEARRARRGLWAHAGWRVREAATLSARDADSFLIVRGTVQSVANVKGRTYLNFGDDWRSDFTVAIAPAALKLCRSAGLDPAALAGKSLRVRGWVKSQNGPLIDLTHPEQIEVLP
jgi:micrococcal nuclease